MKTALLQFLTATGQEKVKTGTFSVSKSYSKAVNILDENSIPDEFKIEQAPKIDKTAIKKAIAAGNEVCGAEIVENESIRIR